MAPHYSADGQTEDGHPDDILDVICIFSRVRSYYDSHSYCYFAYNNRILRIPEVFCTRHARFITKTMIGGGI